MLPKIRTEIFFRLFMEMIVSRERPSGGEKWGGIFDRGLAFIWVRVCEDV